MPVLNKNPSAGSSFPVDRFLVVEGGTGAKTASEALKNLGGLPASQVGKPGGLVPLDATRHIPNTYLTDFDPSLVAIHGPRVVRCGSVNVYRIVNFHSYANYTLTFEKGAAWQTNDHVFYKAPDDAGDCGFVFNGKVFGIQAIEGLIHKPRIVSPSGAGVPVTGQLYVIGSPFEVADTGPIFERFQSADLEIAASPSFTSLLRGIYGNPSTAFEVGNLNISGTVYLRMRYNGLERSSEWSEVKPVELLTSYINTPGVQNILSGSFQVGSPNVNDPARSKVVVPFYLTPFGATGMTPGSYTTDIEISRTPDFTDIVESTYNNPVVRDVWSSEVLDYATMYYMRVRWKSGGVYSDWGVLSRFVTIPDTRSISRPTGFSATLKPNSPNCIYQLSFGPLQANGYSDNLEMVDWEISKDALFQNKELVTSSSYNVLDNFKADFATTYYVRARYRGQHKQSSWSETAIFSTAVDDRYIETPVITYPANNPVDVLVQPEIKASGFHVKSNTFTWTDSHLSSDWQVATDPLFMDIVEQSIAEALYKTTWKPQMLQESTLYYLRVRYRGLFKISNWSDTSVFRTRA